MPSLEGYERLIVAYILCGVGFWSYFGTFLGFIPIIGPLLCMCKIADEYGSSAKIKYIISSILYFFVWGIMLKLAYDTYVTKTLVNNKYYSSSDVFAMFFLTMTALIIIYIINTYFKFHIIFPFLEDLYSQKQNSTLAFFFSTIPVFFYVWLIIMSFKKNKDDDTYYYDE